MSRPTDAPTKEDFRKAGMSGDAARYPRDDLAMVMLCAFNGIEPHQAPPAWWFHPNHQSVKAWQRVADAAKKYLAEEANHDH